MSIKLIYTYIYIYIFIRQIEQQMFIPIMFKITISIYKHVSLQQAFVVSEKVTPTLKPHLILNIFQKNKYNKLHQKIG